MANDPRGEGDGPSLAIREKDLKICDLCGCLNIAACTDCRACGWHGHFDLDPERVHRAVMKQIRETGRVEVAQDVQTRDVVPATPAGWRAAIRAFLDRLLPWRRR